MPALRNAQDVLVTELKEIYSAERQLARAMPKLSKRGGAEPLKEKLKERQEQGARIIEELDDVLDEMGVTKSRPKNIAVEGLIDDITQHLEEVDRPEMVDVLLLPAIQKVEHYCIASWGTAASLARMMEQERTVELMEELLDEGKRFDRELTEIAEKEVNPAIMEEAGQ